MPETSTPANPSRVPALDLLRLVAVGAVILYHYGFWGPTSQDMPQVAIPRWRRLLNMASSAFRSSSPSADA
jgi:peptidoglycan/LPS O-acetylase OafA/YrhL